jgi:ribosomal protein S19E (S16A)
MQSVESKILRLVRASNRGSLIFPEDFSEIGSSEAIRVALHRLEKENILTRVAQGIYVRPKMSKYIGQVLPSAEEVASGIASRDKVRTVPTGAYALNALGLSTQVPMKIVLRTDGSPREVKVGKRTIKFKKTTPKNLLAKGEISRLVIQALKEIGNGKQTVLEEAKIIELLKKEKHQSLLYDILLAPVWIQKIMKKALDAEN